MISFNPSNFQYRALQTSAAQHERNADNLAERAKDTRYPAAQRETFKTSADEERAAAALDRSKAAYYRENGMWPVERYRLDIAA